MKCFFELFQRSIGESYIHKSDINYITVSLLFPFFNEAPATVLMIEDCILHWLAKGDTFSICVIIKGSEYCKYFNTIQ